VSDQAAAAAILDAHPGVTVVSFDFFDTLVTRRVAQPTHVFAEMERDLAAADPRWRGFARRRVEAERRARARAAVDDPVRDVTLEEIWCEFARMPGPGQGLGFSDRQRLATVERAYETAAARPVAHGVALAAEAHRRGLRTVVVSDNYMPAAHIVDMARAAGLDWVTEDVVWVSCEHRGMKHNGVLFDVVLDDLAAPASQILHIGDDPVADGAMPTERGIAVHLDGRMRISHRVPGNTSPAVLPLSRMEAHLRDSGVRDTAVSLGAGAIAIVVASQVESARSEASARGAVRVHFAARDGDIAHRLWDEIRSKNAAMPPASYTSFSRSVVWRAGLERLDADNVHRFVGDDEVLDAVRLGRRVGCDLADAPGGEFDAVVARQVLLSNADRIVEASRALRSRFVAHLASRGIFEPGRHLVVDLGWTASTVADLADLVAVESGGRAHIEGLFTGLYWDATPNRTRLGMRGVAMDEFAPLDDNLRLLGVVKFMEALVTAPHGSVVDFTDDGEPIGAETAPERRAWESVVGRVADAAHDSALALLERTHRSGVSIDDLDGNAVWAAIMQAGHTPRPDEVALLYQVHHVTDIDHEGDGRPMIAAVPPRRTHLTDTELSRIHDALIRRHWMRGSLAAWRERDDCRWMVDEIERIWPHTHPVWVHGGVPR
jgi:FMN phosphatase YigB (HAD superfamily)